MMSLPSENGDDGDDGDGQDDLFDIEARARRGDPETSHTSARNANLAGRPVTIAEAILEELSKARDHGVTGIEFEDLRPEIMRVSQSTVFSQLEKSGRIVVRGSRRHARTNQESQIYLLPDYAGESVTRVIVDELDDEPKSNSPEDLGQVPPKKTFGDPRPEPDPVPENLASSAMQHGDARKFVSWVHDQDLPIHAQVTFGHVVVGLSGFGPKDLAWLCRAIRQAGRAPAPVDMRQALLKRDVSLLRDWED
jgi:hypothetical protein